MRTVRMKTFATVRNWTITLLLLSQPQASAQHGLGVRGSWGWLSPHHTNMWYLVQTHVHQGELFFERRFSGQKQWHHLYRDPAWGAGFMATDAGSPDHLGLVMRALVYYDLPFLGNGNTTLHARFGWGLGWVSKPYDLRDNHRQNAIGSRINAAVLLAVEARRSFGRNTIGAGFALDHQSNASLHVPNLGINLVTFSFSYRRDLTFASSVPGRTLPESREDLTVFGSPRFMEGVVGWASQQVEPFEGVDLPVFSLTAGSIWRGGLKSGWGFGLDFFNKKSLRLREKELEGKSRLSLTQAGVHASYRLFFGDLAIVVDQGFYLYTPIDEKTFLFQRIGVRQVFLKRFVANLTLKTHFGSADHFELGLGYVTR